MANPYSLLPSSPTPYSLLPTPYSPAPLLPTPYSLLPTTPYYSLLPTPYSLLPVPYAIITIDNNGGVMNMSEVVFLVEEDPEGGYT
ncbi:hypothetical protein, partial [Moorena sp. SIO4A5]|uniref:hypothetical protein n=1 Tax=Moorena sp. SIO4A5 TaxID=2607838 RepID=UPI0013CCB93C